MQLVLDNTQSGGVTVNDFLMHAGVPNAPFGGVGESGYGSYHGIYGFLAFSHQRTVLQMPTFLDKVMAFRYPPYDMKNFGKIMVKNGLGFKRGEGMQDQKVGVSGLFRKVFWPLTAFLAVFLKFGSTRRGKDGSKF
jgi:aldehyde dehydrogenase (NAD+)